MLQNLPLLPCDGGLEVDVSIAIFIVDFHYSRKLKFIECLRALVKDIFNEFSYYGNS